MSLLLELSEDATGQEVTSSEVAMVPEIGV
jgi:hypothetical protein